MLACEKFSFRCLRYLAPLCDVNLHENLYGGMYDVNLLIGLPKRM